MTTVSSVASTPDQAKDGDESTKPSSNLHLGSFKPQNSQAGDRRPLTPFLSFGQLSPGEVLSDGNLTSPLLLSPPVLGGASSPPPRKDVDCYFGSNAHQRAKRKTQSTSRSKSRSPLTETGYTNVDHRSAGHSSMVENTADVSEKTDTKSLVVTSTVSSSRGTGDEPRTLRFETFPRTASPKPQPDSGGDTVSDKAYVHESTAVMSLQKFSESRMHSEAPEPPELLHPIASTLNMLFESNNSGVFEDSSDEDETHAVGIYPIESKHNMGRAVGSRRRAKPKEPVNSTFDLDIPATITLRKASEVCQSEPKTGINKEAIAAEILRESGPALRAAVSALAFQSGNSESKRLPPFGGHETRKVLFARDPENGPAAERQRAKSVAGLSKTSKVRRQSLLADTTLTIEEAHADPATFTVGLNPRRHSSSAAGALRRLSTIRAGLRGSVHEIIWQEDEPSSGTSSLPSESPTRKDSLYGSTTYGVARQPGEAEPIGTELNSGPPNLSAQESSFESKANVFQDAVLRLKKSYGNLFNWSWDGRQLGAAEPSSQPADQLSTMAPEATSEPQDITPSIPQTSKIQSFPPLPPRSHTSEWRKAPLPDLNDPTVGLAPQEPLDLKDPDGYGNLMDRGLEMYSSIPNAISVSVDSDLEAEIVSRMAVVDSKSPQHSNTSAKVDSSAGPGTKRSKSVSYTFFAPPTLMEGGKTGSVIGVSSPKRVER